MVIDSEGRRLLSRRVINDETDLLALMDQVSRCGDEITWAVDANAGASLLIAVLLQRDQRILHSIGAADNRADGMHRDEVQSAARNTTAIVEATAVGHDLAALASDNDIGVEPRSLAGSLLARGQEALYVQANLRASRQWFDAAYREAELADDADTMAAAALGLGGLWANEHRTVADVVLVEARQLTALSRVDPASSHALRLRIRLAAERDHRNGDRTEIMAVLDEARRAGDEVALAEALSLAHHCVLGPEDGALRHALALELVRQSSRTHRHSDLLMGLLWRTVDLLLDADPHAERCLAQLRQMVDRDGQQAVGFVVRAMDVMLSIRSGRFDQAEALATATAERGAAAGDFDAEAWYASQLVAIRWYQGRVAELVPMLSELVHSPTLSAVDNSLFAALAVAAAAAGDVREAAGALARLCGSDLAGLPRSSSWLVSLYGIVEAAHLIADTSLAARAYQLLRPFASLPAMASLGVVCFGSVEHALGVASLTTGQMDQAVGHFQAAVHSNLALRHWPAVVMSRSRLAQAHRQRRSRQGGAHSELTTATREAAALGMPIPQAETDNMDQPVVCRRTGRHWEVRMGSRITTVKHCVGMLHLATLLAYPGRQIPAIDLTAAVAALGKPCTTYSATLSEQPLLDDTARRQYQRRLSLLTNEIEEQEAANNLKQAARLRAERDWLMSELSAAASFSGRTRQFTDNGERARIAVGKAIRRAISCIAQADWVIGRALSVCVTTGVRCSYTPD